MVRLPVAAASSSSCHKTVTNKPPPTPAGAPPFPFPLPPAPAPSVPAALEVLHSLTHVSGMWSRHREVLRALASGQQEGKNVISVDTVRVMEYLVHELQEFLQLVKVTSQEASSSSSSPSWPLVSTLDARICGPTSSKALSFLPHSALGEYAGGPYAHQKQAGPFSDVGDGGSLTPQPVAAPSLGSFPVIEPRLDHMPDLVHASIASCLTNNDLLRMMESGRRPLVEVYGAGVREVVIELSRVEHGECNTATTIASIVARRPRLTSLRVPNCQSQEQLSEVIIGLAEAINLDCCNKMETLEVRTIVSEVVASQTGLPQLLQRLSERGMCPGLHTLILPFGRVVDDTVVVLGEALRSRTERGCRGLQTLEMTAAQVHGLSWASISDLHPVLSSGACEALVELNLQRYKLGDEANEALVEWLGRTRAIHLRTLKVWLSTDVMTALCLEGAASGLEVLVASIDEDQAGYDLSNAIELGRWPRLREIKVDSSRNVDIRLIRAIHRALPDLKSLKLNYVSGVLQELAEGACPRLEELDLSRSTVDLTELRWVIDAGGAPCRKTLKRLNLRFARAKAGDTIGGFILSLLNCGCCNLEYLDMSLLNLDDMGVDCLAHCIGVGALPNLTDLKLDRVNMQEQCITSLFNVLKCGRACPKLERLHLHSRRLDPRVMEKVVQRLNRSRRVSSVKMLHVEFVGEAHEF